MKTLSIVSVAVVFALAAATSGATTHTVNAVGLTFSPMNLTIDLGDTVNFVIGFSHTVVEVSQSTWNANGSTPLPGGFSRGAGGGIVVITTSGTHWYVCDIHNASGMKGTIVVNPTTGVDDPAAPGTFSLQPNYPNPFNPGTAVRFTLAAAAETELAVHDGLGRRIATLLSGFLPAGEFTATWDGLDDRGLPAASGAYHIRMTAAGSGRDFVATRKILLVR